MTEYFSTDKKPIDSLVDSDIEDLYSQGYVLTRLPQMNQTRSLRIELNKFELSSENRRVLKKTEGIEYFLFDLPLTQNDTNWRVFAMCKRFYEEKFKDVQFSTNKVRALLTVDNPGLSKFNSLFVYYENNTLSNSAQAKNIDYSKAMGYCIVYKTKNILHYCYPFYDIDTEVPNLGMGMMIRAIVWAKEKGLKYVYLGSFTRPADIYKLQFKGLEFWTEGKWSKDIEKLKGLVT